MKRFANAKSIVYQQKQNLTREMKRAIYFKLCINKKKHMFLSQKSLKNRNKCKWEFYWFTLSEHKEILF